MSHSKVGGHSHSHSHVGVGVSVGGGGKTKGDAKADSKAKGTEGKVKADAKGEAKVKAGASKKGEKTVKTVSQYNDKLRGDTNDKLSARKKFLESRVKDAKDGDHKDPAAAKRGEAKLKLVDKEIALRGKLASGPHGDFAVKAHQMDDKTLAKTEAQLKARMKDAGEGGDKNSQGVADAKAQLGLVAEEKKRRALDNADGKLPTDPRTKATDSKGNEKQEVGMRGQSKEDLTARMEALNKKKADATTGNHRDPIAAANYARESRNVQQELDHRAKLEKGPNPKFALESHGKSSKDLKAGIEAQQKILKDASGGAYTDPKIAADARQKLGIMKAELGWRAMDNKADKKPVEDSSFGRDPRRPVGINGSAGASGGAQVGSPPAPAPQGSVSTPAPAPAAPPPQHPAGGFNVDANAGLVLL